MKPLAKYVTSKIGIPLTTRTYSNSSEIFNFCANYIDPTVITGIELQHPGLVEFRSVKEIGSFRQSKASIHAKHLLKEMKISIILGKSTNLR